MNVALTAHDGSFGAKGGVMPGILLSGPAGIPAAWRAAREPLPRA